MPRQFGTQRLAKNPLDELLAMQENRKKSALQRVRQFPFKDVYEKDGQFYENVVNDEGEVIPQVITEAQYTAFSQQNQIGNESRETLGLSPVSGKAPVEIEEPEKIGFFKGLLDKIRGGGSDKPKPDPVPLNKPAKAVTLDDGQKNAQKNQLANPNLGGANVDLSKPTTGGAVKQSLFDDKIGETSPIVDPRTEDAYQKSLSLKGKPPPNMTKREIQNIGSKGREIKDREKRQNEMFVRGQDRLAQKAWKDATKGSLTKEQRQREAIKEAFDKGESERIAKATPRLSLPSKRPENIAVLEQIQQHELNKARRKASTGGKEQEPEMITDVKTSPMNLGEDWVDTSKKYSLSPMYDSKVKPEEVTSPSSSPSSKNIQYAGRPKPQIKTDSFRGYKTPEATQFENWIKQKAKAGDKKLQSWMSKYLNKKQTSVNPRYIK